MLLSIGSGRVCCLGCWLDDLSSHCLNIAAEQSVFVNKKQCEQLETSPRSPMASDSRITNLLSCRPASGQLLVALTLKKQNAIFHRQTVENTVDNSRENTQ